MAEQVVTVGRETVWIGRGGIRLAEEVDEKIGGLTNCPLIVAQARPISVSPPADAAAGVTVRHFVELLTWHAAKAKPDSALRYALHWQLHELQGRTFKIVAFEELHSSADWPNPVLPREIDLGVSLEMVSSGRIRWRLDTTSPRHGWLLK